MNQGNAKCPFSNVYEDLEFLVLPLVIVETQGRK
jgi:hypothetical protein